MNFADRVKDTTTTTGTGTITLSDTAPTGYRTFAAAYSSTSTNRIPYAIVGTSEWEVGYGTFNGTTSLTRDRVLASSNSNAAVNFSAGTKDVFVTIPAFFEGDLISRGRVEMARLGAVSY